MPHYDHKVKKRFGQHFLHDRNIVDRMLYSLHLQPTDRVVEIGPGTGALTFPLLDIVPHLDVVEIDRDIIAWWKQQSRAQGKLHIHAQDALKLDVPGLWVNGKPLRIIGNLPYNISTPLIFHFLKYRQHIRDMLFMLQKEVVERITAEPGHSTYGRLSVMVQYYCDAHYLLEVSANAFRPPPKVDSAVIYLKPWETPPHTANDPEHFADVVGHAFSQRRKTLRNTLKGLLTAEQIESVGINPTQRAETLSVADFVSLSNLA